jgi:hypothetical protein
VLDLIEGATHGLPAFQTDAMLRTTPFHLRTDVSLKRNLALMLARRAGWSRIFYLDDDVVVGEPRDVRRAVGLLDTYVAAGLDIKGFPDGAVASHVAFAVGATARKTLVSGALAVSTTAPPSFFPTIYNEDLLYNLDEDGARPVAVTGCASQERYDPFHDPARAGSEEFGETVVGGLHYLVLHGYSPRAADVAYWRVYLGKRDTRLKELQGLAASSAIGDIRKVAMLAALARAREVLSLITPTLCAAYVAAWLCDRVVWRQHIQSLRASTAEQAVRYLANHNK